VPITPIANIAAFKSKQEKGWFAGQIVMTKAMIEAVAKVPVGYSN